MLQFGEKKNYTRIYDKRGDWLKSLIWKIFNQILKHLTKKNAALLLWSLYDRDGNNTDLYPSNQVSDHKYNHKSCNHKYSNVKSKHK